jgi:hypothetical protein
VNKGAEDLNPAPPAMQLSDLETPGQVALGLNPAPQKSAPDDSVASAPASVPADPKPTSPSRHSDKQVAASTPPPSKAKPVAPKPVVSRWDEPTPFAFASNPLEDKSSRPHFISNF